MNNFVFFFAFCCLHQLVLGVPSTVYDHILSPTILSQADNSFSTLQKETRQVKPRFENIHTSVHPLTKPGYTFASCNDDTDCNTPLLCAFQIEEKAELCKNRNNCFCRRESVRPCQLNQDCDSGLACVGRRGIIAFCVTKTELRGNDITKIPPRKSNSRFIPGFSFSDCVDDLDCVAPLRCVRKNKEEETVLCGGKKKCFCRRENETSCINSNECRSDTTCIGKGKTIGPFCIPKVELGM